MQNIQIDDIINYLKNTNDVQTLKTIRNISTKKLKKLKINNNQQSDIILNLYATEQNENTSQIKPKVRTIKEQYEHMQKHIALGADKGIVSCYIDCGCFCNHHSCMAGIQL